MKGKPARILTTGLRTGRFLSIVGVFDHSTDFAIYHPRQDNHHLYAWLELPDTGQLYECAINTRLSGQSRMEIACFREPCPPSSWPDFGLRYEPRLSYRSDLDLCQADFHEVHRHSLTDELASLLSRSDRVEVFGFSYPSGGGVHDVHMNSGESPSNTRPDRPGQDGALVLYFAERPGVAAHALWLCLKFPSQML